MKLYFFVLMLSFSCLFGMSSDSLNRALLQAAHDGDADAVKVLLEQGADRLAKPSRFLQNRIALLEAISYRKEAVVEILAQQDFEQQARQRDKSGYCLIHYAAAFHLTQLVLRLKKINADFNDRDNLEKRSPLVVAIETKAEDDERKIATIRQLIAAGAQPVLEDIRGENAFDIAKKQPASIGHQIMPLL